jgi:hypothetical protein
MHRSASGKKPALDGGLSGTLHATIAAPVRMLGGGTCPPHAARRVVVSASSIEIALAAAGIPAS